MNMKYFRFLYGAAAGCLMHLAELSDTLTEEHANFLYLCGSREQIVKNESADTLFLYPEDLDLVVLGDWSEETEDGLKEILSKAKIKMLIIPERSRECEKMDRRTVDVLRECLGEKMQSVETVVSVGAESCGSYEMILCGWKFYVARSETGALALIHAMTDDGFEDIVMNVKSIRTDSACRRKGTPDKFGCAFGCTLHRDYHECKYRKNLQDGIACRMGTVLVQGNCENGKNCSEILNHETDVTFLKSLFQESKISSNAIRFFGFSGQVWDAFCKEEQSAEECMAGTEYFIGIGSEETDAAIAELCRSSIDRIPVLLKEGQGICCSGFFKYREVNGKKAEK